MVGKGKGLQKRVKGGTKETKVKKITDILHPKVRLEIWVDPVVSV